MFKGNRRAGIRQLCLQAKEDNELFGSAVGRGSSWHARPAGSGKDEESSLDALSGERHPHDLRTPAAKQQQLKLQQQQLQLSH